MTKELTIDDTYGYTILDTEEKKAIAYPCTDRDQWWSEAHGWLNAGEGAFWCNHIYRRPIPIGEGYRLVGLDEQLLEQDELWNAEEQVFKPGGWMNFSDASMYRNMRSLWFSYYNQNQMLQFFPNAARRKLSLKSISIQTQPSDPMNGWVSIKDRSPVYPCQVTNGKRVGISLGKNIGVDRPNVAGWRFDEDNTVTHWKALTLSTPPVLPPEPAKVTPLERQLGKQPLWSERDRYIYKMGFDLALSIVRSKLGHSPSQPCDFAGCLMLKALTEPV